MNKERLLKLADHLDNGVLKHDKFNFKLLTTLGRTDNVCGTQGCALGECPVAFPDEWEYRFMIDQGIAGAILPITKDFNSTSSKTPSFEAAETFFDITESESNVLFVPSNDLDDNPYLNIETSNEDELLVWMIINGEEFFALSSVATKEEVAANIRRFVELKEKA